MITEEQKFVAPFHAIMMPLNDKGEGPEMDPKKVNKTVWQVWDAANQTVSEHGDKANALAHAAELNIPHQGVQGPDIKDLTELPRVHKKLVREAKKQALERDIRRKKMNRDPKRQKERDTLMKERNSINSQRERTFKQNADKKRKADRKRAEREANKNQVTEPSVKPEFEEEVCQQTPTDSGDTAYSSPLGSSVIADTLSTPPSQSSGT